MAAVVLRGGGALVLACCCKTWSLNSQRVFAGCNSTCSKANRTEIALAPPSYPFHLRRAHIRGARPFTVSSRSFFNESSEAEAIVNASSDQRDKNPPAVSSADSTAGTSSSSLSSGAGALFKDASGALDIRVGRILRAWRHSEADTLYVEEVDVGEPEPRTICSGLVNYIPLDDLQGLKVIVLTNLKPRNMRGVKSNGMLLAASDARHEHVELLLPPEGSIAGERIWFGMEDEHNEVSAATPNQVHKKKIWESVQPHLKTDGSCVAVLDGYAMRTSAGVVKCRSLQHANIS